MKKLLLLLFILYFSSCSKEEKYINFNQESITINHNEWKDLLPLLNIGQDVKQQDIFWFSDRPDIVSVDEEMSGYIKGEYPGNATITAAIGNLSCSCNVEVIPIMPTDLIFDKPEQDVFLGDEFEIWCIVRPNTSTYKNLKFEIEDTEIISHIEENKFFAEKVGETKVVATIDGTKVSKECFIRVHPILAESIVCDERVEFLFGESAKIDAKVLPDNTTNKNVVWSTINPEIATINQEGVIRGVSFGSTWAIAEVEGTPNVSARCRVKVCDIDEYATISANVGTEGDSQNGFHSYIYCYFNTNSEQTVYINYVLLQDESQIVKYERSPLGNFREYSFKYKTTDTLETYPAEGWVFTINYTWNNKEYTSVVVRKGLFE